MKQSISTKKLTIDLDAAIEHVAAITGDADIRTSFRCTPERADVKQKYGALTQEKRAKVKMTWRDTTLGEVTEILRQKNAKGRAIYIVPQVFSGGTKAQHCKHVRVLVLDLDGTPLPESWEPLPRPHLIVETSPRRFQCWWRIKPSQDFDLWTNVMRRLAANYDGDANVARITQPFRFAGFYHLKGEPFRARIVERNAGPTTTLAEFDFDLPCADLDERPAVLTSVESGTVSPEELARSLSHVPLEPFSGPAAYNRWLTFAMAAHYMTGAAGCTEFVAWCVQDPAYQEDAEEIAAKWDGFKIKSNGVTIGTYIKILQEIGAPARAYPQEDLSLADDFTDAPPLTPDSAQGSDGLSDIDSADAWLEGGFVDDDKASALIKLNETYCAVFGAGRYRIMCRERYPGGQRWIAAGKQDFLARYENARVENGTGTKGRPTTMPLGKAWQEWPGRKTADGTIFDTSQPPAAIVNGALNLWSGFAVTPTCGSCKRFKAMMLNDLCSGDRQVFEYMLRWIAWKIQHTGELPEVAIALIGPKGTGKTTLGKTLKVIFGEHGMVAHDVRQIAGRFNGHLETKCFVYADEAVWGGDKPNESALKALITDAEASYEYKGVQIFTGVNHVGLIFAGNERWIVPASIDERRFCVSHVSGEHMVPDTAPSDHANRIYWDLVHHELDHGGREAFLFELQHMDLGNWHPRTNVPRTAALGEQKLLGLREVAAWYHERLRDGVMIEVDNDGEIWATHPLHLSPAAVVQSYSQWLHVKNPHAVVTARGLLKELKSFGWDGGEHCRERNKNRDRYWRVPKLSEARRHFAEKLGFNPFDEEGE